jgi:hypothetical protein
MGLDITIYKFATGTAPVFSYTDRHHTDVFYFGKDWQLLDLLRGATGLDEINEVFLPLDPLMEVLTRANRIDSTLLNTLRAAKGCGSDTQNDLYIRASF